MRFAPVLILLIIIPATMTLRLVWAGQNNGLLIVTTFDNLKYDVKQLLAPGDRVVSLVPPGVDPHSYSLRPQDIELLKKADLIVSTGHVAFEKQIEKMIKEGVIKAELIEIPDIPGIKLLNNPVTGEPNLHMPIYDPYNYIVFISKLAHIMAVLRPAMKNVYIEKETQVVDKVIEITSSTKRITGVGVGEAPPTQYAVEWIGLKIEYLVLIQPEVPPPPSLLKKINELAEQHKIGYVIVIGNSTSPAHKLLLNLAEKYGLKTIVIPSPTSPSSILDKLEYIVQEINSSITTNTQINPISIHYEQLPTSPALILLGICVGFVTAYYVLREDEKK